MGHNVAGNWVSKGFPMAFDHEIILLQNSDSKQENWDFHPRGVFVQSSEDEREEFVSFVKYKLTTMCIMHYYCVY